MNPARPIAQRAQFVGAGVGSRFRIVTEPADGRCSGTVVWAHAFAEEMNKTRRMSSLMARLLAENGWRVVQRDLGGCGDSAGDFSAASWDGWVADIDAELEEADSARPMWLWCVRAGALLASAVLVGRPHVNLLLWQPVLSGAQHLQQFLRLHAGARVLGSAKAGLVSTPAQDLREGRYVEVGGYLVAPVLADGMGRATFDVPAGFRGDVVWLELSQDDVPGASMAAIRSIEQLRARGIDVDIEALTGPPFWQTVELAESEALLQRSLSRMSPGAKMSAGPVGASFSERRDDTGGGPQSGEQALGFECLGERLWGILARPSPPSNDANATVVVIAVGGPQYRVGSHRQFVLLARRLAEQGYPSLRFDYRGMGDSEGDCRSFEDVGPDLHAAIDALRGACPHVRQIVVWGLCDAASAALLHAVSHAAVSGIVAVNPWARGEASLAAAQVRHYYGARIMQREFWTKLLGGGIDISRSVRAFGGNIKQAWRHVATLRSGVVDDSYQSRMARGLAGFRGRMLLVVAGNDLTAKEFLQHAGTSAAWRGLLESSKVSRSDVPLADHTFSSGAWRARVEDATLAWLRGDGDLAASPDSVSTRQGGVKP